MPRMTPQTMSSEQLHTSIKTLRDTFESLDEQYAEEWSRWYRSVQSNKPQDIIDAQEKVSKNIDRRRTRTYNQMLKLTNEISKRTLQEIDFKTNKNNLRLYPVL